MRSVFLIWLLLGMATSALSQQKIDSLKTVLSGLPDNSVERVDMLNQIGFEYWIVNSNESLKYGEQALEMAEQLDYPKGVATAYRVLGVAHWTKGDMVQAIRELNTSYKKYSETEDTEGVANAELNLGMVYADLNDPEKALELYQSAIDKFTALNLKDRIATTYTKIATVYITQQKLYDAKKYLNNALSIHTENDFTYGIAEVHNRLGKLFIEEGDKEQAYHHIRRSIIMGRGISDEDGVVSNLINYGKLLRLDEQYGNADMHARLGLKRAREYDLKNYELQAYQELYEIKKAQGQPDSALHYLEIYDVLKDSIFNSEKTMQIAALEFEATLTEKDKEVALLQQKERSDKIIKWGLFGGVIVLTVLGLITIHSLKQRNLNDKELSRRKQELMESNDALAKTALENAQLRQQELEQKLDFRNKELTSYTLNFVQKNELFQELQERLGSARSASPAEKDKIIDGLYREIRQHNNIDKNWEDFKLHFEEVHKGFYKTLNEKHPNLSANDLKVCALTRLNMNIKETASVLGISPESAKTARYRLRKKLNLAPEDELLTYFLSLEQS